MDVCKSLKFDISPPIERQERSSLFSLEVNSADDLYFASAIKTLASELSTM